MPDRIGRKRAIGIGMTKNEQPDAELYLPRLAVIV